MKRVGELRRGVVDYGKVLRRWFERSAAQFFWVFSFDFMERNGGWLEWLRRFSTGISIDIPEMEIVLRRGKTSELVQDFTMRGVPGEDVVVIPKKQGRLI